MTTKERIQKVLRCEHVDKPVFFVLSDKGQNDRFGYLSDAMDEIKRRRYYGDDGIQVWADYGDKEVSIDQVTWKENHAIVEYTRAGKRHGRLRARPPYQLLLIDNSGRQMVSIEGGDEFSLRDFARVNEAIVRRALDPDEPGTWMYS